MSDLSPFTATELINLLQQTDTPGQPPLGLQIPGMSDAKLALLLNTDPAFKAALIAVVQEYIANNALTDTDDL
ncbi:hypothetical protein MF271_04900 [Deinococcus sp. KNUC1210]|uniref:hypothetical protein n=1 Tax=Deinococcus sp. KNUC1210 TaxID=2917691 RepID=UPI001EEFF04A|nr:hypothetical protein [Deinococcus sp. KNUC1210]ULH15973.1 hypothetical protein MF271_04900 [Deinococcus sp. KNUC1210]